MKWQFSLRRLFAATALIAMGSGAAVYFVDAVHSAPPMSTLQVLSGLCCGPLIGTGLFTPIKYPVLGAFVGFIGFICLLYYFACISGAMSV
jgi:hypothetical protein